MKNKSSRLFSPGFYVESLRQLRLMGLIYLFLCLIFSAMPPLLNGSQNMNFASNPAEHALVLFFFDYLAPITLAFSAFGFLMRRNSSDLYHSLPLTREAIYLSRALAIATYLLITIVLSLLVSFLCCLMMDNIICWGQLPSLASYHLVCSLLVLSCALVGVSCTGTYFSAFIVTGLLLFLPRMILVTLTMLAESVAPIIEAGNLTGILNPVLNLPAALAAALLTAGGLDINPLESIFNPIPQLYTLVLALIYFVFGCYLHHRRKSELARTAAPSRFLQHLYRCLISLPLFLLIGALIAADNLYRELSGFVLLVICALLIYFLYELITTRKFRNLLPALAVLPIVVIVGLGLPWLGKALGTYELNQLPARDRIESVNLDLDTDSIYSSQANYTLLHLSQVDYEDEAILDLLHNALSDTIAYYNTAPDARPARAGSQFMQVRFNLKNGRSLTRRVTLSPDACNRLNTLRMQNEGFRAAIASLPDYDDLYGLSTFNLSFFNHTHASNSSDDENARLIWETFCEEYAALTPEEKLLVRNYSTDQTVVESDTVTYTAIAQENNAVQGNAQSFYVSSNDLRIFGFEGLQSFTVRYRITSLTPKTLLMVANCVNEISQREPEEPTETLERQTDLETILDNLDQVTDDDEIYLNASLSLYTPDAERSRTVSISKDILTDAQRVNYTNVELYVNRDYFANREYLDTFVEILRILNEGSMEIQDLDHPFVLISDLGYDVYRDGDGYGTGYSSNYYFVQLTDESFNRLLELTKPADES